MNGALMLVCEDCHQTSDASHTTIKMRKLKPKVARSEYRVVASFGGLATSANAPSDSASPNTRSESDSILGRPRTCAQAGVADEGSPAVTPTPRLHLRVKRSSDEVKLCGLCPTPTCSNRYTHVVTISIPTQRPRLLGRFRDSRWSPLASVHSALPRMVPDNTRRDGSGLPLGLPIRSAVAPLPRFKEAIEVVRKIDRVSDW